MTAATEETGIKDISLACSGKINTAGGFQWMKKVVGYPMKISASKPHKKKVARWKEPGDSSFTGDDYELVVAAAITRSSLRSPGR